MTNFVQEGDVIDVTLGATTASGAGVKIGTGGFGVAQKSGASGDVVACATVGVFDLTKDASTLAVGDLVYWDNTNKKITSTSTSNLLIGWATAAAATGDATGRVRLKV